MVILDLERIIKFELSNEIIKLNSVGDLLSEFAIYNLTRVLIISDKIEQLKGVTLFLRKLKPELEIACMISQQAFYENLQTLLNMGFSKFLIYNSSENLENLLKNYFFSSEKKNLSLCITFLGKGVGASVLATFFAYKLSIDYPNIQVCIVDTDFIGNELSIYLNKTFSSNEPSLIDFLIEPTLVNKEPLKELVSKISKNLHYLPASQKNYNLIDSLPKENFITVTSKIVENFDITIFDLSNFYYSLEKTVILLSDVIVLVITPEPWKIKYTQKVMEILADLHLNDKVMLVLNRGNTKKPFYLSKSQIEDILKKKIEIIIPNAYVELSEALIKKDLEVYNNLLLMKNLKEMIQKVIDQTFRDAIYVK